MKEGIFQFRNFYVTHSRSTFKVGTDAILLGGCIGHNRILNKNETNTILDIGCGCGVLSLLSAQFFTHANVKSIDIDGQSVEETIENFSRSPWNNRLSAECISLQQFADNQADNLKFNLIISNPPFFENSLKSASKTKAISRHTDTLTVNDIASCVAHLISDDGYFCCIYPVETASNLKMRFIDEQIYCIDEICVYSKKGNIKPERTIMTFSKKMVCKTIENVYLLDEEGNASDWYVKITSNILP
ncbi:MAG: methyltransferase [Bacteroidales bacterium]|nr:methyltransferase [Bacteroidales bacterium]MBR5652376.1 methyltransferase [Bacteroidales bacterium]